MKEPSQHGATDVCSSDAPSEQVERRNQASKPSSQEPVPPSRARPFVKGSLLVVMVLVFGWIPVAWAFACFGKLLGRGVFHNTAMALPAVSGFGVALLLLQLRTWRQAVPGGGRLGASAVLVALGLPLAAIATFVIDHPVWHLDRPTCRDCVTFLYASDHGVAVVWHSMRWIMFAIGGWLIVRALGAPLTKLLQALPTKAFARVLRRAAYAAVGLSMLLQVLAVFSSLRRGIPCLDAYLDALPQIATLPPIPMEQGQSKATTSALKPSWKQVGELVVSDERNASAHFEAQAGEFMVQEVGSHLALRRANESVASMGGERWRDMGAQGYHYFAVLRRDASRGLIVVEDVPSDPFVGPVACSRARHTGAFDEATLCNASLTPGQLSKLSGAPEAWIVTSMGGTLIAIFSLMSRRKRDASRQEGACEATLSDQEQANGYLWILAIISLTVAPLIVAAVHGFVL